MPSLHVAVTVLALTSVGISLHGIQARVVSMHM